MSDTIQPRIGTLTHWLSEDPAAEIPELDELCYVTNDSGVILFSFHGDGSSTAAAIITAGNRLMAPLRAPGFVGGAFSADGMRVGGSTARFTNQQLFVDGRKSHQVRAFKLERTSDLSLTGGVNLDPQPVPMQAISSTPIDFNHADMMQSTAWFESVTTGGFKPTIPGLWHVDICLVVHVGSASSFPCARAVALRKTGAGSDVVLGEGAGQQGPTGTPLLFLTFSGIVELAADDILRPGVRIVTASSPSVIAGPTIAGSTIGASSSWISGRYIGHRNLAGAPE